MCFSFFFCVYLTGIHSCIFTIIKNIETVWISTLYRMPERVLQENRGDAYTNKQLKHNNILPVALHPVKTASYCYRVVNVLYTVD